MLLIAGLIILNTLLFSGIGWAVMKTAGIDPNQAPSWGRAFWAGWAAAAGILQIWHFFLPVQFALLALLAAVSAAGWLAYARQARLKDLLSGRNLVLLGAAGLALLVMSNHVLFAEPSYDHGLYHLQTAKWFSQYPVVRGLGNLHHRLAFNSVNLLVGALLNSGPLAGTGIYSANSTAMFALAAQGLWALGGWISGPQPDRRVRLYGALLLPASLWQASQYPLTGYSADMVIFALQAVLGGLFLQLADKADDADFFRGQSLLMVMLIAAGVSVKLSFAVFGAALLACMLVLNLKSPRASKAHQRGLALLWVALICAWVIPWLARNALMSGYLLYPSAAIALPVAWTMPGHLIGDISAGITEWARTYSGQILYSADLAWFSTWVVRFVYEARQALIMSGVMLAALAAAHVLRRPGKKLNAGLTMLAGVSALSILFWFFSAPTYRFSGAAIWILYACAILGAYRFICEKWGAKSGAQFSILFIIFLFYALRTDFSKNISPARLLTPLREDIIAEQQQPLAGMQLRSTQSGLQVYVPPENSPETCWNAALPCTTRNDYLERLQLLEPGDLGGGFFVPQAQQEASSTR